MWVKLSTQLSFVFAWIYLASQWIRYSTSRMRKQRNGEYRYFSGNRMLCFISLCKRVNTSLPCATDADSHVTRVTMATVVLRSASFRTTKRGWIRRQCMLLRVISTVCFNNILNLIVNGDRLLNVPHLAVENTDVYWGTTSQTVVEKW
jgi:hypothetical protein